MLQSMTGFGRGEASNSDVTVVVELKSVNNRFRDIQLRTPREYMALEARIQRMIKGAVRRGRVDAFIRRTGLRSSQQVVADVGLAQEYALAIRKLMQTLDEDAPAQLPFDYLISQPGVLMVSEATIDPMTEWSVVETALTVAIEDLSSMRVAEGKALEADLVSHLEEVRMCVAQVEAVAVGVNDRLRQRLDQRIHRMLGERFDAYRMAQEVAILADKADVSEEIARLRSHCDQFAEALQSDDAIGRRLDFLLQEMNREVNTVGSKAVDLPIHRKVVEMKTVLERMREQAANVE